MNRKFLPVTADIWKLIRQGNEEAFKAFYHDHWADLYKAAYNVLQDRDSSMDIVQEIFIWVWINRDRLEIKTSFKGYLLTAVKFKAANYIRNGKAKEVLFQRIAAIQPHRLSPDTAESIEIKELEALIHQTVKELPEKCREIFQLSRNSQMTNKEIAHTLDVSVKTVENQMTIALKRLRVVLIKHFFSIFFL